MLSVKYLALLVLLKEVRPKTSRRWGSARGRLDRNRLGPARWQPLGIGGDETMRIGIAMQSLDPTWGGIGIYTKASVEHLLKIDRNNECCLIYSGYSEACDQFGELQSGVRLCGRDRDAQAIALDMHVLGPNHVPRHSHQAADRSPFNPFWITSFFRKFKEVIIIQKVEQDLADLVFVMV
jgi:hypothetical protein